MIGKISLVLLTGLNVADAFSLSSNGSTISRKFGVVSNSPLESRYSTSLFSEEVAAETAEIAETVAEPAETTAEPAETAEDGGGEFWEGADEQPTGESIDIYCGNLDWDIDEDFLADEFAVYGEVSNVFLPRDRESGRKRGFAFVTMVGRDSVERAIAGLDGEQLYGRNVRVNEAQKREPRQSRPAATYDPIDASSFNTAGNSEVKLYVGNLNYDSTKESVKAAFEGYGTVNDCFFPIDRDTGNPRGFCFVTMGSAEALSAANEMNGKEFEGRTIRVSESKPRER
mmetsp:Transcript_6472/g.13564  ORF Transcript_6472/g.13564 Transcript_6472/m.13564 type:complete len:285 (+) Transcript_6472:100-954(+)